MKSLPRGFKTALLVMALAMALSQCATPTKASTPAPQPAVSKREVSEPKTEVHPKTPDAATSPRAKMMFDDAIKALTEQRQGKPVENAVLARKFQAALDADPQMAEAAYNLGVLSQKAGDNQKAADYYRRALQANPSLRQAAANLAVIAENSGDEQGSLAMYQKLEANFPDDSISRGRLADMYRRKGDCLRATTLAKEALYRNPRSISAIKVLMGCAIDEKQYSMAKLFSLRAVKIDENDPDIQYLLGMVGLGEKQPEKARSSFQKSVQIKTDYLPGHVQLASLALAQQDYVGAEASLRKVLQIDGKNVAALVNLGIAYRGQGQFEKAIASYEEAQKLDPELKAIYLNEGIAVAGKGDHVRAIELFKKYVALNGGETVMDANHGVFEQIRQQEAAIRQADEAKKMEAEEKAKKDAELQKIQAAAKGAPAPAQKVDPEKPPEEAQ